MQGDAGTLQGRPVHLSICGPFTLSIDDIFKRMLLCNLRGIIRGRIYLVSLEIYRTGRHRWKPASLCSQSPS